MNAANNGHVAPIVQLLLDNVPSMLAYWDRDLKCRFANRAYERWFGVDPESLVGTSIRDLLGETLFALNEPYIRRALAGEAQTFERVVPGPQGAQRHSLAHYLPHVVEDEVRGFMVLVNDVSILKQCQARLRQQVADAERAHALLGQREAALREAQRLGGIGSWEWEIEADIVTWSEQLYRMFGLDPLRLPPSYAQHARLYAPESFARLQQAVASAVADGTPYALELEFVRADGQRGWLESRAEAVRDADGRIVGIRGTALDITARRRDEHQRTGNEATLQGELATLRQRNAELEREVGHARRERLLGTLAAGMTHDFNNVLSTVDATLRVLHQVVATPGERQLVERGQRGIDGATHLVRQLLSFARPEAGRGERFRPATLLNRCSDLLRMALGAGVALNIDAPAQGAVYADPRQLEVALLNLALNAKAAMPAGGSLAIDVIDRSAGTDFDQDHVAITVRDRGVGMSLDVLARARDAYFTTRAAQGGSGLGLAMVDAFARESGGMLAIESELGRGTSVTIRLPRDRAAD